MAVAVVLLFHADVPGFDAGFLGVDIFFVISGFLITRILLSEIQTGTFSLFAFYERRARRLLPALFVVMLATFGAAWFILLPEDYRALAESSLWASLFASNFYFLQNIDYHAPAAETLPLLHTWSLAVEEQFYLIWPALLLVVGAVKRGSSTKATAIGICLIGALSLLAAWLHQADKPDAVFYLPWYRFWELALGALIASAGIDHLRVLTHQWLAILATSIGLVLIFGAVTLGDATILPLGMTVCACLGAACVLVSGHHTNNPVGQLLSLKPIVFAGRISYGLYLWHWPVFALFRVWQNDTHLSDSDRVWLIVLTFILASLSYWLIEKPLRRSATRRNFLAASGLIVTSVAAIGIGGLITAGYESRIENRIDYVADRKAMRTWACEQTPIHRLGKLCILGSPLEKQRPVYLLWGDSHTQHFAPLIDRVATERELSVIVYTTCTPSIDHVEVEITQQNMAHSKQCGRWRDRGVSWVNSSAMDIQGIIVAGAWAGQRNSLKRLGATQDASPDASHLTEIGLNSFLDSLNPTIPVALLSDMPRPNRNPVQCAYHTLPNIYRRDRHGKCEPIPRGVIDELHEPMTSALQSVSATREHVFTIDVVDRYCTTSDCSLFLGQRLLYRDGNHIRSNLDDSEIDALVERLGFNEVFERLIRSRGQ